MDISLGETRFRLMTTARDGRWVAQALRADTGERFGPEEAGRSEPEALERLKRWLEWQHEHAAALDALQTAERAYHRSIAGAAFARAGEADAGVHRESLDTVDAARARLDDIRARRPM